MQDSLVEKRLAALTAPYVFPIRALQHDLLACVRSKVLAQTGSRIEALSLICLMKAESVFFQCGGGLLIVHYVRCNKPLRTCVLYALQLENHLFAFSGRCSLLKKGRLTDPLGSLQSSQNQLLALLPRRVVLSLSEKSRSASTLAKLRCNQGPNARPRPDP